MVKFLEKLLLFFRERSGQSWASFEVGGFTEDGQMKVTCNWNSKFIKEIYAMGFQSETEDDSVQLFFYTVQARPPELFDGAVSEAHPNLTDVNNTLRT